MSSSDKSSAAGPVYQRDPNDLITRGSKKSTPLGTTLFVGLRALDPFLQYGILASGVGSALLYRMGLNTIPMGDTTSTGTFIDSLGLSPHRLVLLSMATGSAMKQIFTLLVTTQEEFPASAAIPVAIFNTVNNSVNTLLFTCAATSASINRLDTMAPSALYAGAAMYLFGILLEVGSEVQRRRFKDDPKNAGKAYTDGLWRYVRHVNYAGYTFWRAGFALASAGWIWGAFVFGFFTWDFNRRAIPVLDRYCSKRYGEQWEAFKRKTPYKLFPGLL